MFAKNATTYFLSNRVTSHDYNFSTEIGFTIKYLVLNHEIQYTYSVQLNFHREIHTKDAPCLIFTLTDND